MNGFIERNEEKTSTEEYFYIDDGKEICSDAKICRLVELTRIEDVASTCRIFVRKDVFNSMEHKLSTPNVNFKSVFKKLNDSESCIPKKCNLEDHYTEYYLLDEEGLRYYEPQMKVLEETCSINVDTTGPIDHVRRYFIASRYKINPINVQVIRDEENIALINREHCIKAAANVSE